MEFPQYIQYKNELSFFKISSVQEYTELKIIGKYYSLHTYQVSSFVDRNFLNDLLQNTFANCSIISEVEYQGALLQCKEKLTYFEQ